MKVGILGGTFDPPHAGHLIVAQDAVLALDLDRLVFIPAAQPPHKQEQTVTEASLRLRMLELAVRDDDRFEVDTLELEREGASYTVDTLRALRAREPQTEWVLLIGWDQYREFHTWHEPDEILRLATLAVVSREGLGAEAEGAAVGVAELRPGVAGVAVTRIDISSTMIRRRVARGLPIRYLVPEAVERFILEQRLYSRNGAVAAGYDAGHANIRE